MVMEKKDYKVTFTISGDVDNVESDDEAIEKFLEQNNIKNKDALKPYCTVKENVDERKFVVFWQDSRNEHKKFFSNTKEISDFLESNKKSYYFTYLGTYKKI